MTTLANRPPPTDADAVPDHSRHAVRPKVPRPHTQAVRSVPLQLFEHVRQDAPALSHGYDIPVVNPPSLVRALLPRECVHVHEFVRPGGDL